MHHHEHDYEHKSVEDEVMKMAMEAMKTMFFKSPHGQKYVAEHNKLTSEEAALCTKWENFQHRYKDDLKNFIELHQQ